MAALKTFNDIRYFVKNSITTSAFAQTFIGSSSGTGLAYPWSNLDSDTRFTDIVTNHEVKFPTALTGNCTLTSSSATVTAVSGTPFLNALVGDYLLYNDGTGTDNLKVLGVIATRTSNTVVVLAKALPSGFTTNAYPIYLLKKGGASVGFKADASFFILVKSPSYAGGVSTLRDAVLWLNVAGSYNTPTEATAAPALGWGSDTPVNLNADGFFNFFAISKINAADEGADPIDTTDIPCTIRRVSNFGLNNSGLFNSVDEYPFWVAYEINPFANSSFSLNKKTTFKIQFDESLPAEQLTLTGAYTWVQQGAI
jgi:hypothetical protein